MTRDKSAASNFRSDIRAEINFAYLFANVSLFFDKKKEKERKTMPRADTCRFAMVMFILFNGQSAFANALRDLIFDVDGIFRGCE